MTIPPLTTLDEAIDFDALGIFGAWSALSYVMPWADNDNPPQPTATLLPLLPLYNEQNLAKFELPSSLTPPQYFQMRFLRRRMFPPAQINVNISPVRTDSTTATDPVRRGT